MDNQKFGAFLAQCRKEKGWTQKDLAARLHVTDKAVSKWERGLGFPDIKLIEPLAAELGVSILELMRSESIPETELPSDCTPEIVEGMVDIATHKKRIERRNTAIAIILVTTWIVIFFLVQEIENFDPITFILYCAPIVCFSVGTLLLILCLYYRRSTSSHRLLFFCGLFLVLQPVLMPLGGFFLLLVSFYFGASAPW